MKNKLICVCFALLLSSCTSIPKKMDNSPSSSILPENQAYIMPMIDGTIYTDYGERNPAIKYLEIINGENSQGIAVACKDGEIVIIEHINNDDTKEMSVTLKLNDGNYANYSNLVDVENIKKGDNIKQGDVIGKTSCDSLYYCPLNFVLKNKTGDALETTSNYLNNIIQ